ncbi:MAG TPA: T9SS type A sorting domain-containing protein [Bacteroidia bacterium]|jgi:hypothetical protein|nr:T9SS type A sorting domain-containing protein [Bacteroidia bacterium]
MKKIFYASIFSLTIFNASRIVAQIAVNDNCSTATFLGVLPAPATCSATTGENDGTTIILNDSNIFATPETPYVYQGTGCTGSASYMSAPAYDVWYSFIAPSNGYGVNITVSNATFSNPNIALYSGSCGSLGGGVGYCAVGSGGVASLLITSYLIPGQTYYIQVSGGTNQKGTFKLSVYALELCNHCVVNASSTVNPQPINASYNPGQVVNFCYHVDQYSQINTNWLHGVQLKFGPSWDTSTLVTTPPPPCSGTGFWAYYKNGVVSIANGTHWPAGFYFETTIGQNNPGDNFGDNCTGTIASSNWNFCFSIQSKNSCTTGSDLSVRIGTSADGQSGSWSNTGCVTDSSYLIPLICNGGTTIIGGVNTKKEISIFPNPATDNITIRSPSELGLLTFSNCLGEIVFQTKTKSTMEQIDVSKLPAGIYSVQTNNSHIKFVKE